MTALSSMNCQKYMSTGQSDHFEANSVRSTFTIVHNHKCYRLGWELVSIHWLLIGFWVCGCCDQNSVVFTQSVRVKSYDILIKHYKKIKKNYKSNVYMDELFTISSTMYIYKFLEQNFHFMPTGSLQGVPERRLQYLYLFD